MAVTWDWKEKCGEATLMDYEHKTYNVDLYVGNCFLIMIREFVEDEVEKYAMECFFVDKEHMERCLKDNIFDSGLKQIRINKGKCRNYKKIVDLLIKYMDNVEIEIYKEGKQTYREIKEADPLIHDIRMRELAETAISYLNDNGLLDEFAEDRGIEFTTEEKSYFGIYDEGN